MREEERRGRCASSSLGGNTNLKPETRNWESLATPDNVVTWTIQWGTWWDRPGLSIRKNFLEQAVSGRLDVGEDYCSGGRGEQRLGRILGCYENVSFMRSRSSSVLFTAPNLWCLEQCSLPVFPKPQFPPLHSEEFPPEGFF